LRAERIQSTIPHLSGRDAKQIKADNSLSDLPDGHGWARSIANGNSIRTVVKGILAVGPDYQFPSGSTMPGGILERQEYERDKTEDNRILGLPGMSKHGFTLMTDGAAIQRHPLFNVVLFCSSFSATVLHSVIDASEHLATGASKDAEYITRQIIPVIYALPNRG